MILSSLPSTTACRGQKHVKMTECQEVYNKTFDTIKSKYDVEKVTLGHCLSLILYCFTIELMYLLVILY